MDPPIGLHNATDLMDAAKSRQSTVSQKETLVTVSAVM